MMLIIGLFPSHKTNKPDFTKLKSSLSKEKNRMPIENHQYFNGKNVSTYIERQ